MEAIKPDLGDLNKAIAEKAAALYQAQRRQTEADRLASELEDLRQQRSEQAQRVANALQYYVNERKPAHAKALEELERQRDRLRLEYAGLRGGLEKLEADAKRYEGAARELLAEIIDDMLAANSLTEEKLDGEAVNNLAAGLAFGPAEQPLIKLLTLLLNEDYINNWMGHKLQAFTGFTSRNARVFANDHLRKASRSPALVRAWMEATEEDSEA